MREILFRGKRLNNGEWKYGSYAYQYGCHEILLESCEGEYGFDGYAVDPATIGQYTGLTDKNGKKIFEGDILQFSYTGKNQGVEGKAVVTFENGKFGVKWGWHKDFVCLDGFANTNISVIGNIYDNHELMRDDNEES